MFNVRWRYAKDCYEEYRVYAVDVVDGKYTKFLVYDNEWIWLNAVDCVPINI